MVAGGVLGTDSCGHQQFVLGRDNQAAPARPPGEVDLLAGQRPLHQHQRGVPDGRRQVAAQLLGPEPLTRGRVGQHPAAHQVERRDQRPVRNPVDPRRGEPGKVVGVGRHVGVQPDPARVGVGQVGLPLRIGPEPRPQPAHVRTAGALGDEQRVGHLGGGAARVLQQPGAHLQQLRPGADGIRPGRTDEVDRSEQQQGGHRPVAAEHSHDIHGLLVLRVVGVEGTDVARLVGAPPSRGGGAGAVGEFEQGGHGLPGRLGHRGGAQLERAEPSAGLQPVAGELPGGFGRAVDRQHHAQPGVDGEQGLQRGQLVGRQGFLQHEHLRGHSLGPVGVDAEPAEVLPGERVESLALPAPDQVEAFVEPLDQAHRVPSHCAGQRRISANDRDREFRSPWHAEQFQRHGGQRTLLQWHGLGSDPEGSATFKIDQHRGAVGVASQRDQGREGARVVHGVARQLLAGDQARLPASGVAGEAEWRRIGRLLPGEGDRLLADHDLVEARQRVPGAVEVAADAAQRQFQYLDLVESLPPSQGALQPGQLRGRLQQPASGLPHPGAQQAAGLPASGQGRGRERTEGAEQCEVGGGRAGAGVGGRRVGGGVGCRGVPGGVGRIRAGVGARGIAPGTGGRCGRCQRTRGGVALVRGGRGGAARVGRAGGRAARVRRHRRPHRIARTRPGPGATVVSGPGPDTPWLSLGSVSRGERQTGLGQGEPPADLDVVGVGDAVGVRAVDTRPLGRRSEVGQGEPAERVAAHHPHPLRAELDRRPELVRDPDQRVCGVLRPGRRRGRAGRRIPARLGQRALPLALRTGVGRVRRHQQHLPRHQRAGRISQADRVQLRQLPPARTVPEQPRGQAPQVIAPLYHVPPGPRRRTGLRGFRDNRS